MNNPFFSTLLSSGNRPFLVAGPCSAETEQQVLATAQALQPLSPALFRAGIWKPRTRPNSFEGIGTQALVWLGKVKEQYQMPVATEVASPQHVEDALTHGVDVVWLGARTTVNPFLVQEIAEALRGTGLAVMVKNPVNPELGLWVGAVERLAMVGITDVAAIHRGFSRYGASVYRNPPTWQIPIEFKARCPEIPLICDPSHIAGKRSLLQQVSQKAMDLNYEGLMIETHLQPEQAWSDASQQITPQELAGMLQSLVLRQPDCADTAYQLKQEELRSRIDRIDHELVEILAERMAVVEKIGEFKKQNGVTILQMERWREIFETRPDWASSLGLSADFVRNLYELIHLESIRKQTEVMNIQKSNT